MYILRISSTVDSQQLYLFRNPSLLSTKTLPYVGRRTTCIYLSVYGVVSSHGVHSCQCLGGTRGRCDCVNWTINTNEKERVNADGPEVVRGKKIP